MYARFIVLTMFMNVAGGHGDNSPGGHSLQRLQREAVGPYQRSGGVARVNEVCRVLEKKYDIAKDQALAAFDLSTALEARVASLERTVLSRYI